MKNSNSAIAASVAAICLCAGIFAVGSINSASQAALSEQSGARHVVVVDAGHGGVDGGAVSESGIVEKNINLNIALRLRELLQMYGYDVVMTRETDISIHDEDAKTIRAQKTSDLHNRLAIANSHPEGILVSIHQNSCAGNNYGTQVFFSANNSESEILAKNIQDTIHALLQPNNERLPKPAGSSIYILYEGEIPSVMVECGFLSTPDEARLLDDEDYQAKLAFLIADGINKYYYGEAAAG